MTPVWKTKTFWTSVVAIVAAGSAFSLGEIDMASFIETCAIGLIGIFLRRGMVK